MQCRICFDEEENVIKLVRPCKCAGTSAHVHRTCLDTWRTQSDVTFGQCLCCKADYKYVPTTVVVHERSSRRWFAALVLHDTLIMTIAARGIINLLADASANFIGFVGALSMIIIYFALVQNIVQNRWYALNRKAVLKDAFVVADYDDPNAMTVLPHKFTPPIGVWYPICVSAATFGLGTFSFLN
jgi:hypothetical protein